MQLYREESRNPKWNAQRNLSGRTHYVEDDTLRFFYARIVASGHVADGLLFCIVESHADDSRNTSRSFRGVIFDLFGTVIYRPEMGGGFRTRAQASKAMKAELAKLDPIAVTQQAIARQEKRNAEDIAELRRKVAAMTTGAA